MDIEINKVIGLSKLQYINLVDGQYNVWCEHLSYTFYVPARELQKSPGLYNWFLYRWNDAVVYPFLEITQEYILKAVKDTDVYMDLFQDQIRNPVNAIIGTYPSPIINNIKKAHYKSINNK